MGIVKQSMLQDLRYALRIIRQQPWFSTAIIGTLALGIGVNTTIFTLVNAVLFKPLSFPGGERIVMVSGTIPAQGREGVNVSYPDLRDYRAAATSFERLEAFSGFAANVSENGNPPERYRAARITSGLFEMLHMQPPVGRGLTAADEKPGAEQVAIISDGIWKDRYGRRPEVIGRTIRINEKPAVIIGVTPEGFKFPSNEEIWTNLAPDEQWEKRDNQGLMMTGMLKPGRTRPAAQAELAVVAQRLEQQFPDSHKGHGIAVQTFHEAMNGGPIKLMFTLLMGAVGLVLLIACANVANMLLGRALTRRREISIRVAMGASRARILRQLLVESVLLALIGGLIGLALSQFGVEAFSKAVENVGKPGWIRFEMDYVVFAYFGSVSVFAGILFGLMPAIQATRVDLNEALKEGAKSSGGRRTGLFSSALVVFQFTLAVILLSAAGLMIRSFLAAQEEFAGLRTEQVLHARVNLPTRRYTTPDARRQFFDTLMPRMASLPGAQSVALVSVPPGAGSSTERFEISGQSIPEHERRPVASVISASPGYFGLLGVSLTQGRDFKEDDGLPGKESIIISQEFARKYFPGADPIGRQVRFFDQARKPRAWLTIVALSPDIRQNNPGGRQQGAVVFTPYRWDGHGSMGMLIRTAGNATSLAGALRQEVQRIDGELPLSDVETLDANMARNRWHLRVFGTLFLIFALIALGMAAVGIYAVIAHATGQRTREIGVRLALGARGGTIVRMVLNRGLIQIAIGMAIGMGAALYICRLMESVLLKVSPSDPVTFGIVGFTLFSAGLAACLVPARRAARLDPLVALRHE